MKKRMVIVLVISALLFSACGAAQYASEPMVASDDYGGGFVAEDAAFEMEAAPGAPEQSFQSGADTVPVQRMVIKNAQLSIVVIEPAVAMDEIMTMAEAMGGFVVSSNLWQTALGSGVTVDQASITIRVPAEQLDEALAQIKAGAGEVRSENISGERCFSLSQRHRTERGGHFIHFSKKTITP